MSRIHALQSSTTSQKLLESVCSLRPLLCEALRASGCDTTGIEEQDPILLHADQSLQKEDVQGHTSGPAQHYIDVHAQFAHVWEELAYRQYDILPSEGHIHDLDVNAEYRRHGHMLEEYVHAQHCNPRRVARQSHYHSNNGDCAIQSLANVQHHLHGRYQDAPNHGDAPLHHMYHGHGHPGDAHHYERGHNANSMFVCSESLPLITVDYSPKLTDMQKNQEQMVRMSFRHSFPTTVEPFIKIDPYTPLLCTHYPQGVDNHGLIYQCIHTNHNHSSQQQFPSETMAFVNTMPLKVPGRIIDDTLIGAEATSKISNIMYECMCAHDLSWSSTNNVDVHEVHTGHQLVNGKEVPSLPAELRNHVEKQPRTKSKQFECSDESEGTDTKEGVKLLSLKGEATTSTMNTLCERRKTKRRNEELYARRDLVPGQEMRSCKDSLKYKIFEVDVHVVDTEQKTYRLCIHCEREDGVLRELTKALEALNLDMLNASIGPTNEIQCLYTAVVKVDAAEVCAPDVLKESILKSITKYGFHL